MTTTHTPCSLVYDAETTRPGEQTFAEPDPIGDEFARRLRDIERAGKLRNVLVSAEFGALESARFRLYTTRDLPAAERHVRAANFYRSLYRKVVRLQARARGEAAE